MLKLSIMTEEELTQIFGALDSYIPLHEGEYDLMTCQYGNVDSFNSAVYHFHVQ